MIMQINETNKETVSHVKIIVNVEDTWLRAICLLGATHMLVGRGLRPVSRLPWFIVDGILIHFVDGFLHMVVDRTLVHICEALKVGLHAGRQGGGTSRHQAVGQCRRAVVQRHVVFQGIGELGIEIRGVGVRLQLRFEGGNNLLAGESIPVDVVEEGVCHQLLGVTVGS